MNPTIHQSISPSAINAANWSLFYTLRRECGLDQPPALDALEEVPPSRRYSNSGFRRTIGAKLRRNLLAQRASADPRCQPLPGEIRLKDWMFLEARRLNIVPLSVYHRWKDGKYPKLQIRRVPGRKAVFVRP